jgi:hypothetical protein
VFWSLNVTGAGPAEVFSATTATDLSVFLNASIVRTPSVVVAVIRTAPGRTKRLKFANADSLPDGITVSPSIWIRLSLSPLLRGVDDPHQYGKALRFAVSSPAKICPAQVSPDAGLPLSQSGSQLSKVDHSVSQAGLVQPDSGPVTGAW